MAVERVDVVAQPDAGVGDLHRRGPRRLGQPPRQRAGLVRREALLEAEEAGRLALQARVDPARGEPVVVVAGRHDQLALRPERAADVGEERRRDLDRVAVRGLAQLERVAEDHEPVDLAERLQQRRAQVRAAQQVVALGLAEVQVGDDERPHGGVLVCPPMPPLDGILVADFSRVLAGPLAAMLLGDLGADVIKVERPDGGDDTRAWGPPWRDGESTYYLGLNRNKRSIALDLKDDGDLALARTLAERADVLIESFRPGLIAEFGLDGDSLRDGQPRAS